MTAHVHLHIESSKNWQLIQKFTAGVSSKYVQLLYFPANKMPMKANNYDRCFAKNVVHFEGNIIQ
jgi:hypothetical protein